MDYVNYIGVDVRYKDDNCVMYSVERKYDYKCFNEPEYLSDRQEWFLENLNGAKLYINKNEIIAISWKIECVEKAEDSEIHKIRFSDNS